MKEANIATVIPHLHLSHLFLCVFYLYVLLPCALSCGLCFWTHMYGPFFSLCIIQTKEM